MSLALCGHHQCPGRTHLGVRRAGRAVSRENPPRGRGAGRGDGLPWWPHLPASAHLIEGVEIPFTHVLLEDPRLRRERNLDLCLGGGEPPGNRPQSPRAVQVWSG